MAEIDVTIEIKNFEAYGSYSGNVRLALEGVDTDTLLEAIGRDEAADYFGFDDTEADDE